MLADAAKDARNRAENILSSAGNTGIGKPVDADMGIIHINDTTSLEKDIITIVHAEYQVN